MNNLSLIDAEHPWPGLLPFTEDARAFFHGRESETDELLRLIEREPLTVLFGQSGLGKSSLLNAGVFPRLRRAGYLPIYLRLNLEVDSAPLMSQVWQALNNECVKHGVSATPAHEGDSFWQYLHRPNSVLLNPHGRPVTPVLTFDQFEELFTVGRQTPEQRARYQTFLQELGELVENRLPPTFATELTGCPERLDEFDLLRQDVKIVFTFREDYLAEFESLKTQIRPIMLNRMRLTPMNGNRASYAIVKAGAGRVKSTVAERIVRFVGGVGSDESTVLDEVYIEPALLSLVCRELNEQRIKQHEAEINADLIEGENTQQIIERFYIESFAGLNIKVRSFVEDRLLTTAGYRDSCALDNALAEPGVSETALQTLVDRRILRREERGGRVRLELIHDVLVAVAKASREQRRWEKLQSRYKVTKVMLAVLLTLITGPGIGYLLFSQFPDLGENLEQIVLATFPICSVAIVGIYIFQRFNNKKRVVLDVLPLPSRALFFILGSLVMILGVLAGWYSDWRDLTPLLLSCSIGPLIVLVGFSRLQIHQSGIASWVGLVKWHTIESYQWIRDDNQQSLLKLNLKGRSKVLMHLEALPVPIAKKQQVDLLLRRYLPGRG